MECMEARALKSSYLSELATKSTQHVCLDDFLCLSTINAVSCDDFSVDVFLDLPDNDFKDVEFEEDEEEKDLFSVSSQDRADDDNANNSTFSGTSDSGSSLTEELAVPVDDLENLEWLSQFVDDSVSELSLLCPPGSLKEKTGEFAGNRSEQETEPPVPRPSTCFPAPVPSKARSKRSRPNTRVWSLGSPCISESSSSSSSSSSPCLIFPNLVDNTELFYSVAKPAPKKQKRKASSESSGESQTQRRCSHCHVQKTPQWRTGPLGPKTLCNACGVRYKSGRLYPEYRPACSPTFSGDVHSNSHRKVLEMRRNKEMSGMESGLTSLVPSF